VKDACAFLRGTDLCAAMSELELKAFASFLVDIEAGKGRLIFRKGEPGNRIYFGREGWSSPHQPLTARGGNWLRFGPGLLGEMAIVGGVPRLPTVLRSRYSRFAGSLTSTPCLGSSNDGVKMLLPCQPFSRWLGENGDS
jgi:CRP-like cAMP-binding protein